MGKRKVLRVLVVDSVANAIAPMMAVCFNGNFDRSEGSVAHWSNYARAFEHDADSPRTVNREVWNFMVDRGFMTDGLKYEIECIGDMDLGQYHLIYCVGTEAYAEVRGITDRMEKADRPTVHLMEEDIENPFEDDGEGANTCSEVKSEAELEAADSNRLTILELFAAQIKRITAGLMTHTPNVEPARK